MSRAFKRGDLLKAFKRGDVGSIVDYLCVEDGPEISKVTIATIVTEYKVFKGRSTPLTIAIQHGNYHLCRLLVQDGHPLTGDSEKRVLLRPLSLALHLKHWDIAELFIELGADVNMIENDKNTYPLFWAIHKNQTPRIIDLIISAGFPVNGLVMKNEKMAAIQCAVLENNMEAVKTLIKYPVDLNVLNSSGESALGIAIRRNLLEIVRLLVEKGASLHNRNMAICPLLLAIRFEHLQMVELLLDLGADLQEGWVSREIVPPLQFALNYMNIDIVMCLIGRGADVKAQHRHSHETALHVVTTDVGYKNFGYNIEGNLLQPAKEKIVKELIKKGADVNVKDIEGRTPLDGAIFSEKAELCKILLREGAEIIGKGQINNGFPLQNRFEYICCMRAFRCPELIKLGLERGGDYNYRDRHGLSPYHCVMAKHDPDMVRAFWQHGCPYDQPELKPGKMKEMLWYEPDPRDRKILYIQAEFMDGIKNNRLDSVESALEKGAEPKGCSMKIPSTLHYTAANGNHNIAKLLLEKGVAVNRINEKGETPLYIAVEKKNVQTCKVFLQNGACFDYHDKRVAKNKTIKILVQKSDQVNQLFKKVYQCFKLAKRGNKKLLKILEKCKTSEEEGTVDVLMNCVNGKGLTLLATVLRLGYKELSEDLMLFRLRNLSSEDQ